MIHVWKTNNSGKEIKKMAWDAIMSYGLERTL